MIYADKETFSKTCNCTGHNKMQRMAGTGAGALVSITFMHSSWTASTNINVISNFYCSVIQLLKTRHIASTDPSTKSRTASASKYMTPVWKYI